MRDDLKADAGTDGSARPGPESVRLDVWLWAVRLFKTRSAATEACRLGRVTGGLSEPVKPSRAVRPGDIICLHEDFLVRKIRVDQLVHRRVGAPVAAQLRTELTPAAEVEKARALRAEQRLGTPSFAPGTGRPTKAQRRALDAWRQAAQGAGQDADSDGDH